MSSQDSQIPSQVQSQGPSQDKSSYNVLFSRFKARVTISILKSHKSCKLFIDDVTDV